MSLRKLPDLDDEKAMAKLGRLSALRSARLDAVHDLRDLLSAIQRADTSIEDEQRIISDARICLDRLETLHGMTPL